MTDARSTAVPGTATAQRPSWDELPEGFRRAITTSAGAPVTQAASQGGGFTHGFASRLLLADGHRAFVKAAPLTGDWVASAYRREAEIVSLLPDEVNAARVLWTVESDGWLGIGFDDVEGAHPARPWRPEQLERVVDALAVNAAALTPVPAAFDVAHFSEEFDDYAALLATMSGDHVPECRRLARHLLEEDGATTLVHNDLRDDNMLLTPDGRVVVVDWSSVSRAPAWFDLVCLLVGPHSDGLDVDAVLTGHPLTAAVAPDLVDGLLVMLYAYFCSAAASPAVTTSPFLREHQRWYRDAVWSWVARRRGWSAQDAPTLAT